MLSDADLIRIGEATKQDAPAASSASGKQPLTSSTEGADDDELTLFRRGLYCKALLYVAGSDRRARDWIVGWACALQGTNAPLIPIIMRYEATPKDLHNFWRELQGRDLPHDHERLAANCLCLDAATVVALSSTAMAGSAAEARYSDLGAKVGAPQKWLGGVLELAIEERHIAWEKAQVLEGGSGNADGSSSDL